MQLSLLWTYRGWIMELLLLWSYCCYGVIFAMELSLLWSYRYCGDRGGSKGRESVKDREEDRYILTYRMKLKASIFFDEILYEHFTVTYLHFVFTRLFLTRTPAYQ